MSHQRSTRVVFGIYVILSSTNKYVHLINIHPFLSIYNIIPLIYSNIINNKKLEIYLVRILFNK